MRRTLLFFVLRLVILAALLGVAVCASPTAFADDPDFSNVTDILNGQRYLLHTDDLMLTGLLPGLDARLAKYSEEQLRGRGVEVHLGTRLESCEGGVVRLSDERIAPPVPGGLDFDVYLVLTAAALLAFGPSYLYFSRFAREDIYFAATSV